MPGGRLSGLCAPRFVLKQTTFIIGREGDLHVLLIFSVAKFSLFGNLLP
jgi:hypothetical protein